MNNHQRSEDAFIPRWARRLAYTIAVASLPLLSFAWKEREEKVRLLNTNIAGLQLLTQRVNGLEKRVDVQHTETIEGQQETKLEIKGELRLLREEVRQMYLRAIAAGGRNP